MRLGFLLPEDSSEALIRLANKKEVSPYLLIISAIEALERAQHVIEKGKGVTNV